MDAHPDLGRALDPVPHLRRAPGHPPDRDPRARLRHRPRDHRRHRRPRGRAARPGRPPPPHGHRRPGGAGGARRARLRVRRLPGPRPSSTRSPTPSRGRSAIRRPGRGWRALAAQSDRGRAVAGRTEPARRPLGPVPLRRLPHPLPAPGPLRLVAAGALRGRRPAAGGRDALGPRTTWVRACPARAIRHAHQADLGDQVAHRRRRGPGRPRRAGPGPRPPEPPDVVDPRGRGPGERPDRGDGPTTPPATPAAGWSAGGMPD